MAEEIATAPRTPGLPINTEIGIVGWAQELHKAPPPFLQRGAHYEPEISRKGGWRRMVWDETLGWAFLMPMDILHPKTWSGLALIPTAAPTQEKTDGR